MPVITQDLVTGDGQVDQEEAENALPGCSLLLLNHKIQKLKPGSTW